MKTYIHNLSANFFLFLLIFAIGFALINTVKAAECPPGGQCPPSTGSGLLGSVRNWFGGSGNTGGTTPGGSFVNNVNNPAPNINTVLPPPLGGLTTGNANPVAPAPKSTLYTSSGWDTPNAAGTGGNSTCGPCNALATTNGKFDPAKANFIKQNYNVETNGPEGTPTIKDPKGNKLTGDAAKKKIDEEFAKVNQKPVKCGLVEPGQSKVNEDMWGEPLVARPKDVDPRPLLGEPGCKPLIPSTCAHDIDGTIKESVATIAKKRVSELNWWFYKLNPTGKSLGVTSDADFNFLTDVGKASVAIDKQSNQKNLTTKMQEGATIYVPKTKEEHQQYRSTYPAAPSKDAKVRNGYTPKNGSTMRVTPGAYTSRLTNSADNATPGAPDKQTQLGTMPDTKVTDDCKFEKATPSDWSQITGQANQWGNIGGNGSTGGTGGGGLEGILPKILEALQSGLSGLGGGGQGQPNASPSPTPAYVCPPDSEPACGEDGITYENRCTAEYKKQIKVKHAGACTAEDQKEANLSKNSTAVAALMQQLATSGMPTQLVTDLMQIVSKLMTSFLTGTTVLQETVVQ